MGVEALSPAARSVALNARAGVRLRERLPLDQLVFVALVSLLIAAALLRREFLGDGVRHLPAVLSDHLQFGEPRWVLFPAAAQVWIQVLSRLGLVSGAESALEALLALSVASGVLFLAAVRVWLHHDCADPDRRAAALLLAGSCAPVLILFSDVAEPQLAAAVVVTGLAYARIHRDDPVHARSAALGAVGLIAVASLIYQGAILALGMLPLVVSGRNISRRQLAVAAVCAVLAVGLAMTIIQVSRGASITSAITTIVEGEQNPLTRSLMGSRSVSKYFLAAVAGPPQGIVALDSYGGLRALASALHSANRQIAASAARNLAGLLSGFVVTAILAVTGVRQRQWRVLIAAAILLTLPVVRNQQYGYVKFYVLWPIPVALVASRCTARTSAVAASFVLALNLWVVGGELLRGRENYQLARAAYATATPATCWLTSGWTPPFAYLWPGTATPILGILATGSRPEVQRQALTSSLKRCFCESDGVWTDSSTRDAATVQSIASHFNYDGNVLSRVLLDPRDATSSLKPGILVYESTPRRAVCRALQ